MSGFFNSRFGRALKIWPVTIAILLLGLIGYLLPRLGLNYYAWFYYPPLTIVETGDYWRLISPAFLHFGEMHILFNGLWMWELGRRVEFYFGRLHYLLIFLLLALAANTLQFYAANSNNFGGLSGVVYGLVGFLLIARFAQAHPVLRIADGIFVFMLVFLALGYLGVLDFLVAGKVGNAAHLGGLLMGLFLGLIYFHKGLIITLKSKIQR